MANNSRRQFIRTSASFMAVSMFGTKWITENKISEVDAHLWVYASRYPPDWDCYVILEDIFSDIKVAGYDGLEIMESILRHKDAVVRLNELQRKYNLPVTGTSYYANMWNKEEQQKILDDISAVLQKLKLVKAKMIGLTVGDARRMKTETELDVQADTLKKILKIAAANGVEANLHNHTFEVINNMHDLKGTLARVPEIKLGPDLNWLIRGGVDPVWFIRNYGHKITYMHIRDQDSKGIWTEAVGEGATDFKSIAAALRSINFNGRIAVELAFDKPPVREVKEDWRISRTYIRKIFGR